MAGSYVLDACVAAKVLFEEDGTPAARALVMAADRLIAPDLVVLEVANVALKKVRQRLLAPESAREVIDDVMGLYDRLVPSVELHALAMDVALRTMVSSYDAIYVALALRQSMTLVTADKRFAASLAGCKDVPEVMLI